MATLRSRVIRKMVLMETKVHAANMGPIIMQGCQELAGAPREEEGVSGGAVVLPWYQMGGVLVTIRKISV